MRDINAWRLPLQEQLFSLAMAPSTKQKSASAWAKARKDGISLGSQFKRGQDLAAYRTIIESNNERTQP